MSDEIKPGAIPLRERRTLGDEWEDFEKRIIPKTAGPIQRQEMKRAFYGGAGTMFGLLSTGFDKDEDPTEIDLDYMTNIHNELRVFQRDIEEGRA